MKKKLNSALALALTGVMLLSACDKTAPNPSEESQTAPVATEESQDVSGETDELPLVIEEEFDGKFFAGREVNLQGLGEGDVNIVKWVITQTDKNGFTTSKETEGASCTFTMPDCNRIAVNAYIGSANGISTITSHTWQWQYSDNKVIVSNTDVGTSVSLYNLQGIRLWRATSNGADVALPANGKQPYILQVGDERIKISL